MLSVEQKIIGTWKLVYSAEIDSTGNKVYPLGTDAIGFIIYDAYGKMAVQISKKERQPFNREESVVIAKDYLAYFGRYEIDTANELVRHFIEGHILPDNVGKILERKYHFFENKMSLK